MNAILDHKFQTEASGDVVVERFGYRRNRKSDSFATLASLAVVVGAGSAFLFLSPIFVKKAAEKHVVVTLMALPEDPPPQTEPQPDTPLPPPVALVTPPPQVVLPPVPTAPVVQQTEVAKPAPPSPPPAAPAPPAARGPENLGEISSKMIAAKPPRYPMDSRRAHEEGTVVLSVLLSTDGRVTDISIARSSGFARLDRAALDAVREWRWSPLMRDGNPVMVRGSITIPFVLQGGGGRDGGPDHRGGHGRGDRRGGPGHDGGPDGGPDDDFDKT